MADPIWKMKGQWLKSCNCDYGCPCDFNSLPSKTSCEGMLAMKIEEGYFKDVNLDGVVWAGTYAWPGALHEGNGTFLPVVDEKATDEQRNAILTILSGQEQVDGTFFQIVSMIVTKVIEPKFLPIEFEFNQEKRTARVAIPGVLETVTNPIKNPITGAEHRIQTVMPEGFEYHMAETASADVNKGLGEIQFDWPMGHSALCHVEHTSNGVVHS
jgi:hypothetical protein